MKRGARGYWRRMLGVVALSMAGAAPAQDSEGPESARPAGQSARAPATASGAGANLDLTKLNRKKTGTSRVDVFSTRSIYPAPPPRSSAPPPQPAVPSAPPLPFRFLGKFVEGDAVTLFLAIQEQDYSIRLNDILNDTYRVDQINDDSVVFTYLPLNVQQTLPLGRPER